jgi:dephospho-CoA kinase
MRAWQNQKCHLLVTRITRIRDCAYIGDGELKIIGFIGLPGSGKGEASSVAREMGIRVAVMGDVVRREAARLGFQPTDENFGKVGNMLRDRYGQSAIAQKCFENLGGSDELVVVDGIRSKHEVDYFKAHSDEFHLVEIWAPPQDRLRWIVARGRPDDPQVLAMKDLNSIDSGSECLKLTAEALEKRELREIGWGMRAAIDEADLKIVNEGDIGGLRRNVETLLKDFLQ